MQGDHTNRRGITTVHTVENTRAQGGDGDAGTKGSGRRKMLCMCNAYVRFLSGPACQSPRFTVYANKPRYAGNDACVKSVSPTCTIARHVATQTQSGRSPLTPQDPNRPIRLTPHLQSRMRHTSQISERRQVRCRPHATCPPSSSRFATICSAPDTFSHSQHSDARTHIPQPHPPPHTYTS